MGVLGTGFASDFDGTLCMSDWDSGAQHFAPATLEAIRRYQEAGGLFGVCTGRTAASIVRSCKGIVDLDFYIVATGAQVLGRNLEPLFEAAVEPDVARELYDRYAAGTNAFVLPDKSGFAVVGPNTMAGLIDCPQYDRVEDVAGPYFQVSLEYAGDEDKARAACESVNAHFADVLEAFQNRGSVDIVARGCSKGAGVRVVKEALGLANMGGAGDSYNDLSLLEAADVSYTFHDSPASVRDAATCVVANLGEAVANFQARA